MKGTVIFFLIVISGFILFVYLNHLSKQKREEEIKRLEKIASVIMNCAGLMTRTENVEKFGSDFRSLLNELKRLYIDLERKRGKDREGILEDIEKKVEPFLKKLRRNSR